MRVRPPASQRFVPRRQVVRAVGAVCVVGITGIFLYTTFHYQEIREGLHEEIRAYGALGLLLAAFVVDTFGGPLGPEVPVVGGWLAGIGLPVVLFATTVGSGAASLLVYAVGFVFGEYGAFRITSPERFARWRRLFLRHRRITLALGALTPVPYVTLCLLGGVFRVPLWEFVLFAICARVARIGGTAYVLLLFEGAV